LFFLVYLSARPQAQLYSPDPGERCPRYTASASQGATAFRPGAGVGYGTVFKITAEGELTNIHTFSRATNSTCRMEMEPEVQSARTKSGGHLAFLRFPPSLPSATTCYHLRTRLAREALWSQN